MLRLDRSIFGGASIKGKIGAKSRTKLGVGRTAETRNEQATNEPRQQKGDDAEQHCGGTECNRQPSDGGAVDLAGAADQNAANAAEIHADEQKRQRREGGEKIVA